MASDAPPQRIKHDVFVNFRGKDVRKGFTSHLRDALDRNGIDAFTDKGLKGGEEISSTLSRKIFESLASVVIFTPNYADSRWCLDELVMIMDRMESHGQTVLPVFLHGVEPTHVRNQTGAFGDGFERLVRDARYADKAEIRWRRALKQAADLSGWDSLQISEAKIVEKILKRIQSILDRMSPDDPFRNFVGMERVEEVESLLTSTEVKCLGLWGLGGSGKTTLAEKIYHRIYKRFEGACFIKNVREFAERGELIGLCKDLLRQLLGKHDPDHDDPFIVFSNDIRRKLGRRRLLVILDDVSDASQLSELIGDCSVYCPQSKIIVTSRNNQVLKSMGDKIYQVENLKDRESLQLMKLHAFKQRQPTPDQMELLQKFVKYSQGLPLALVILGRNLFDKDIVIWKSELEKLSNIPDLDIIKILRISYDGLEDTEKSIFLDIACSMKGWNKDRAEHILDACGFYPARGIARLADKALVTISNNTLQMHDLIQQMGQHIGKLSRFWRYKDIADLLTKKQETEEMKKIEVISMDFSKAASMVLRSTVFKKMTGLRILHFHDASFKDNRVSLREGLKYLPDNLRYLQWDLYPLSNLPSSFNLGNLVDLCMVRSNLTQLWTGDVEPSLPSLKYVDLSFSEKLKSFPKFRNSLKLEKLDLSYCKKLKSIPEISQHASLKVLSLLGCSRIVNIPQLPQNLIALNLSLTKIKELPPSIDGLSRLEELWLRGCEIESLPDYICDLPNLNTLVIEECKQLLTLPANFNVRKSLRTLSAESSSLISLPMFVDRLSSLTVFHCYRYKGDTLPCLKSFASLTYLHFISCNLKSLPEDVKYLTNLLGIYFLDCPNLRCIPELPPRLSYMDASNCKSLGKYTRGSTTLHNTRFAFRNCFNLKKDDRDQIWREFWQGVQSTLVYSSQTSVNWSSISATGIVPGNEMPEWIKYSEIGSSLHVKTKRGRRLGPHGFMFCAVVAVPFSFRLRGRFSITCDVLPKSGERFYAMCQYDHAKDEVLFEREHAISWYVNIKHSEFYFDEATFLFAASMRFYDEQVGVWFTLRDAIVKCGVAPIGRTKRMPAVQDGNSDRIDKRKRTNDEHSSSRKKKHTLKGTLRC